MSNISWYQSANINDYYYVKLHFTSNTLNPTNSGPIVTFYLGWSNTWHLISGIANNSSGLNNFYITTLPPFGGQGSQTIFLVSQNASGGLLPNTNPTLPETNCGETVFPIGDYFYKVRWNGTAWVIDSCLDADPFAGFNNAACFSFNTLSLLYNNIKQRDYVIICREFRGNKKMYRCNYPKYGILEFTADHPFFYNKKLYDFEHLVKIHPVIKKTATEIDLDDEECGKNAYIYNVIWHPEQTHIKNTLYLSHNLSMVGGNMSNYYWNIMKKKTTIFRNIVKDNCEYSNYYNKEPLIKYYDSGIKNKVNVFLFLEDNCAVIEL